jgi:hypothetical protein
MTPTPSLGAALVCLACERPAAPDDHFCGAWGTRLAAAAADAGASGGSAQAITCPSCAAPGGEVAAAAVPYDHDELGPGACTLAVVAVAEGRATFAWVGDSRAHWVGGSGATQVSRDDS